MHISFITSHFPFYDAKSVGGIGTSIKNLSDELIKLGHSVTVFVYGQNRDEKDVENGISIIKIKNVKFKGVSWFLTRKKIQNQIIAEHKISKIDVIETPDWEGISSFITLPFPIVIRLNGSDTYFCHLDHRKVKWINKFHEKRALQKADGHLSVSKFTADLTNILFGLKNKYTIIPNGINVDNFKKEDQKQVNESNRKDKTILYFGGIIRKKGLLEIPHYFNIVNKKNREAQLILVGKDMPDSISGNVSTFEMMKLMFSEGSKNKVSFLGSVPYQEIKKHIENAALCIFPSYAEALPVSWLEAMAMEKSIVTSNIGWANEMIIDGESGFLVNPEDHCFFAERILQLLQDEQLSIQMGINARERVEEKFTTSKLAKDNIEFYKKIISQKNKK